MPFQAFPNVTVISQNCPITSEALCDLSRFCPLVQTITSEPDMRVGTRVSVGGVHIYQYALVDDDIDVAGGSHAQQIAAIRSIGTMKHLNHLEFCPYDDDHLAALSDSNTKMPTLHLKVGKQDGSGAGAVTVNGLMQLSKLHVGHLYLHTQNFQLTAPSIRMLLHSLSTLQRVTVVTVDLEEQQMVVAEWQDLVRVGLGVPQLCDAVPAEQYSPCV